MIMSENSIPATSVLAIASHVSYGYVGNTMATFVMQSLGCEVTSINTVQYSNHTGYKQFKGRKTTAAEITDLYEGLKQSYLNESFDVLLSGYVPSAEAVEAVGKIGRDLRFNSSTRPGSFFWVLDPVMGDEGRLYIPEDEVPQYKALLRDADLILPNQFEAELLSETKITDLHTLAVAIKKLHRTYQIPHIIITSLCLDKNNKTIPSRPATPSSTSKPSDQPDMLTIIGSTATSDHKPRLFRIDIPAHPIFFSGTGDMFAALTVARFREAVAAADLLNTNRWKSHDDVPPTSLPLATACSKVLASMQSILGKTFTAWQEAIRTEDERAKLEGPSDGGDGEEARQKRRHLKRTRAAEVRVVQNAQDLREPPELEKFQASEIGEDGEVDDSVGEPQPDEPGATKVAGAGEGAVQIEGGPY